MKNKNNYFKQLAFFGLLVLSFMLIYEFILEEIDFGVNILAVVPITSGVIPQIMQDRKSKLMTVYAKLPHNIMELYWIRFAREFNIAILWIILLIPFHLAGIELLAYSFFIVVILFLFSYLIFYDMKAFAEKYKKIKKWLIIPLPIIGLILLNIGEIVLFRNLKEIYYGEILAVLQIILIGIISLFLSYKIFEYSKSYKM